MYRYFSLSTFSLFFSTCQYITSAFLYFFQLNNTNLRLLILVSICRCFSLSTFLYFFSTYCCIAFTFLYFFQLNNTNLRLLILVSIFACFCFRAVYLAFKALYSIFCAILQFSILFVYYTALKRTNAYASSALLLFSQYTTVA